MTAKEPLHVSLEDAGDSEKLAAALATAKEEGRPLIIGADPESPPPPVVLELGGEVHISAADARDPVKYRRAREIAATEGKTLVLDPAPVVTPQHADGTVIIPRAASPQEYRRMKADAETRGVPYQVED
jgi:hypothetical protein